MDFQATCSGKINFLSEFLGFKSLSSRHPVIVIMEFEVITNNVDEAQALIYMWEIYNSVGTLLGRYVGKAKDGGKRPRKHYKRNVKRLLSGKPYRKSNPKGYRKVHIALSEATGHGHRIILTFLCNVNELDNINDIEQAYIQQKNCQSNEFWQLNG